MNEKQGKRQLIGVLVGLVILLSLCAVYYGYRQSRVFVYQEHLDDAVLSVDGRDVTLREFGFYIASLEGFVDKQAKLYDRQDPLAYWNKHFRAGLDSQFVSLMARNKAYDVCICDMIYEKMALDAGCELNAEDEKKAQKLADEVYQKMDETQRDQLGISKEMIEQIQRKKVLIAKFAKEYVKTINFDGYKGYREELISSGGAYYEKEILPLHTVKMNERIKEGLKFGKITINQPDK